MHNQWQRLLHKEMSRKDFLRLGAVSSATLFGITGLIRELQSQAATMNTAEAEKGLLGGAATIISNGAASGGSAVRFGAASPVNTLAPRVIFDSDLSSDWDDAGDIAVLHGLALLGECQIVGMAVSSQNGASALMMDAVNTYYGKPNIPIGVRPDVGGNGLYPAQIAAEFPHDLQSSSQCPLAKDMYRKVLAESPDKSVIIVTAGYLNNLEALLKSGPDQFSPLNGVELVRKKVKLWACAGGGYPNGGEFNFTVEPAAAFYTVNNWPAAAIYTPDNVGRYYYTAGIIDKTPASNPIRRVYVDIKNIYPYPSWTQVAIYQAIRGNTGLFSAVTVGFNKVQTNGTNNWIASPDPSGDKEQAYIVERARKPVTDCLNAAMVILPPATAANLNVPGPPSDLKATVTGNNRIELSWLRNSYNETGFVIEQRTGGGSYSQIGTVGAGVTNYSVTNINSTTNVGFRVKAINGAGSSYVYSYVWIYSGWTEINLQFPGQRLPLYTYYQTCHLRWDKGGDYRVNHVALNNDSSHGQNLTVNVLATAQGSEGNMYLYFFYRDQNNWYRLNHTNAACKFEKCIDGVVTQIGAATPLGAGDPEANISNGSPLIQWQVVVTAAGALKFTSNGVAKLSVTDALSFPNGKIGLGGASKTPVWEDFNFY